MAISTVPSSPISSSLRKFFFSASLLPSSIPLHSHLLLHSHSSRPFCSISSSLTIHHKVAEKLGEEDENLTERAQKEEPFNVLFHSYAIPRLSLKEKKELASYAHGLGKKLKSQQVGKSGVTPAVAAAMVEAFEANELLKLKVHGSCPGELSDVIKQLESTTGSAAVGQIGRTVILYRPSLTKMKKNDSYSSIKQQQTKPVKSTTVLKTSKNKQVTRTFRRSQQ